MQYTTSYISMYADKGVVKKKNMFYGLARS